MNATPVNQRELVRLLYLEHGHQKASQLSGVQYDTVRQWAHRYGWTTKRSEAMSQNVTKRIVDTVADELAEHERETRLSLARSSARMAKSAERSNLRDAPNVHKVAQIAGIVHRWDSQSNDAKAFTLNVLNLGELDVTVRSTADTHNEQSAQGHSIEDAT